MDFEKHLAAAGQAMVRYRVHLIIFLVILFLGLTIAHPRIMVNDEWITTNQLSQLHDGHQILTSEGKFGSHADGSMSDYFIVRANLLGYPLFLSVIALPAYWLIDLSGSLFTFFLLYLWTLLALLILLLTDRYFPDFSRCGRWNWTAAGYVIVFLVFFISLAVYNAFPTTGPESFPEILAIVFSNILLLAIIAVIVYETCLSLFDDVGYSVFGTIVCLACSSYFFWITGCKDHLIEVALFSLILMSLIKFGKSRAFWYMPLAFLATGLLAWERPEVAFWVFLITVLFWCVLMVPGLGRKRSVKDYAVILATPFFTVLGALPFFLNNYLVTKNFLRPSILVYNLGSDLVPVSSAAASGAVQQAGSDPFQIFFHLIHANTTIQSQTFFSAVFGIFLLPSNFSIGVLILVPVAVIGILLLAMVACRNQPFSRFERDISLLLLLMSAGIFLAYLRSLDGLNASIGIMPDIRYFTPMYLTLNLLGLIGLKKSGLLADPVGMILKTGLICIIIVPLSLVILAHMSWDMTNAYQKFEVIRNFFTLVIAALFFAAAASLVWIILKNKGNKIPAFLVAALCAFPLIWQIDISFLMWQFGVAEAYTYWIPVVRVLITGM